MSYLIKEAAERLGLSSSTIRRWEREGRLKFTPKRDAVGRRIYTEAHLAELRRILANLHGRPQRGVG